MTGGNQLFSGMSVKVSLAKMSVTKQETAQASSRPP